MQMAGMHARLCRMIESLYLFHHATPESLVVASRRSSYCRGRLGAQRTFRDARSTAAKVAAALAHFLSATARLVALRRLRSRGSFGPRCEACWAVRLLHDRNATAICLRHSGYNEEKMKNCEGG